MGQRPGRRDSTRLPRSRIAVPKDRLVRGEWPSEERKQFREFHDSSFLKEFHVDRVQKEPILGEPGVESIEHRLVTEDRMRAMLGARSGRSRICHTQNCFIPSIPLPRCRVPLLRRVRPLLRRVHKCLCPVFRPLSSFSLSGSHPGGPSGGTRRSLRRRDERRPFAEVFD